MKQFKKVCKKKRRKTLIKVIKIEFVWKLLINCFFFSPWHQPPYIYQCRLIGVFFRWFCHNHANHQNHSDKVLECFYHKLLNHISFFFIKFRDIFLVFIYFFLEFFFFFLKFYILLTKQKPGNIFFFNTVKVFWFCWTEIWMLFCSPSKNFYSDVDCTLFVIFFSKKTIEKKRKIKKIFRVN